MQPELNNKNILNLLKLQENKNKNQGKKVPEDTCLHQELQGSFSTTQERFLGVASNRSTALSSAPLYKEICCMSTL